MATQLQAALQELHRSMGGRPYVLLYDPLHPDVPDDGFSIMRPAKQPDYVTRGVILEGIRSLDRQQDLTEKKEGGRIVDTRPPEDQEPKEL